MSMIDDFRTITGNDGNADWLCRIGAVVQAHCARWEWAEEEIVQAQARWPEHADLLARSMPLLSANLKLDGMSAEYAYRAHCREILDRLAAGMDTRPGTAAEVCCALIEANMIAPLSSTAKGLELRMWKRAGFPEFGDLSQARADLEPADGAAIDEYEEFGASLLAVPERQLARA